MRNVLTILLLMGFGANQVLASISFNFYGKNVVVESLSSYTPQLGNKVTTADFQKFEQKVMQTEWVQLFDQLNTTAKLMKLDDYGTFNLYKKAVLSLNYVNTNTKKALVYMGMRMRNKDIIAVSKDTYFDLYIKMHQAVDYGYSITHKGTTYYSTNPAIAAPSKLQVLDDTQFNTFKKLAFVLDYKTLPAIGQKRIERKINFKYGNKQYNAQVEYNQYYVNYLDDLPTFTLGSQLLEQAVENYMFAQLDDSIALWTQKMDEIQKLNFLLHLTQFAFKYKADSDYRLNEKRNTVFQSLHDEYIDCEDKAVLYLFLAKRYCNRDGVLLYNKTKKHVNCALKMDKNAAGFSFTYNKDKYMVAEPAFEGYDVGETDYTQDELLRSKIISK